MFQEIIEKLCPEKNRQAIRSRLSDLRGGVYASCGDIEGLFAQYQDVWDKREEDQKIMPLPRSTTA